MYIIDLFSVWLIWYLLCFQNKLTWKSRCFLYLNLFHTTPCMIILFGSSHIKTWCHWSFHAVTTNSFILWFLKAFFRTKVNRNLLYLFRSNTYLSLNYWLVGLFIYVFIISMTLNVFLRARLRIGFFQRYIIKGINKLIQSNLRFLRLDIQTHLLWTISRFL